MSVGTAWKVSGFRSVSLSVLVLALTVPAHFAHAAFHFGSVFAADAFNFPQHVNEVGFHIQVAFGLVAPFLGPAVLQPEDAGSRIRRIMFDVGHNDRLTLVLQDFHGLMAIPQCPALARILPPVVSSLFANI